MGSTSVLLPQILKLTDAFGIGEKIKEAILQPFDIEGHTINITCSIGIALFPDHGEDEQTLLNNADAAMYQAKSEGRNLVKVFDGSANFQQIIPRVIV
ncbi:MAG: GGDEF domain-containing protein [Chlorobiaceae bacterium]